MGKRDRIPAFIGLSRIEYLVLEMLVNGRRELYGLEMVEMSEGLLKRGTIYVTLGRMQEKGYITSRLEGDGGRPSEGGMLPRRLYKPTGLGERAYAAVSSITRGVELAAI